MYLRVNHASYPKKVELQDPNFGGSPVLMHTPFNRDFKKTFSELHKQDRGPIGLRLRPEGPKTGVFERGSHPRGSGSSISSPVGSGAEPQPVWISVNSSLKKWHGEYK